MNNGANYGQQSQNQPQNMPNNQSYNWNNPVPNMNNVAMYPWYLAMLRDPNALATFLNMMNNGQGPSMPSMPNMNANPQPTVPQPNQTQVPVSSTVNQISSARVITSLNDIKPSEVPVDDTTRIFMTDDLQTIYAKKWDNNGELKNMVFQRIPDEVPNQQNSSNENNDSRFSQIEERIDTIIQVTKELANKVEDLSVNTSKSTQKKGGAANA